MFLNKTLHHNMSRFRNTTSSLPVGKSAVLQRAIAAAIRAQLAVPWLPTNCRLPLHGERQVNSLTLYFIVGIKALVHRYVSSLTLCGQTRKHFDESLAVWTVTCVYLKCSAPCQQQLRPMGIVVSTVICCTNEANEEKM